MNKVCVFLHGLLLTGCCLVSSGGVPATSTAGPGGGHRRAAAESTVPIPTLSPPEGNTTFLGGTTWCVVRPGAEQTDVQKALDWACGPRDGAADCSQLQEGSACFEPDTLLSHASYAFNSYYQQSGNSDVACNFGGAAVLTTRDPSYGSCEYLTSGPISASPPLPPPPRRSSACWVTLIIVLMIFSASSR